MLDSRPTKPSELPNLRALLEAHKLCFNDLKSKGVELFSVTHNERLIGYFGYEVFGSDALFRSFIVVPQERKKNYGVQIWEIAKKHLKQAHVKHVYLLTNTATNFFNKVGYEVSDRDKVPQAIASTNEFQSFCPTDSICMVYDLK